METFGEFKNVEEIRPIKKNKKMYFIKADSSSE